MNKLILSLGLVIQCSFLFAQNRQADSLHQLLLNEKTDTGKADLLSELCFVYEDSKPDSSLLLAQQAYYISKNEKYLKGESLALGQMSTAYKSLGNFPKALEYCIERLKIEEAGESPSMLAKVYLSMASLYDESRDFEKGLVYARKADSIIIINNLEIYAPYSLLDMGDIFEKQNRLDSAIIYTRKCLDISVKTGNTLLIGTALNNLGNIYRKSGNDSASLKHYKDGIPYQLASSDFSTYVESTLGIAKIFEHAGPLDSVFWYGKQSFDIAASNGFTVKALNASIFLSGLYKKTNRIDSAFAYQEIMVALKDSIESSEKIRQLQNISTAEQLRQAELEQQRLEQIRDREIKLQLLVIGIMIPIFFLLSIVISRKKVHKKLIEFTGIVSVLLFFEYVTLLLHPFIAEKTHHSPIIEIVIFVGIAAILTPMHHRIEHWLLSKLAEYNYLKHHKPQGEIEKNITDDDTEKISPSSVIQ